MTYRILADTVVLLHGLFILFVVLGALLAVRWPRVLLFHAPAALWGAWVELAGWICPLTPLENRFRRLAGDRPYDSGFVERYVTPLIYPEGLTREVQVGLGILVLALNGVLYAIVVRRVRRSAMRGPG